MAIHQVSGTVSLANSVGDIHKGDRFLSKDKRDGGRIVEVVEVFHGPDDRYRIVTEVHPNNPSAVNGRRIPISGASLRKRFTRISR